MRIREHGRSVETFVSQVIGTGGNRTLDPRIKSPAFNGHFPQEFASFPLSLWPDLPQKLSENRRRLRGRCIPWSARPTLFSVPSRLSSARRREHLLEIQDRCIVTLSGCWLYPAVRDEGYPYIDVTGDDGEREQWSARRYVWALVNGDIPEGGIILGNCPPKACVNPEHQWLWVPPRQFDLFATVVKESFPTDSSATQPSGEPTSCRE